METEAALEYALRKHVEVLTVDIGPRTVFHGDSLTQAAQGWTLSRNPSEPTSQRYDVEAAARRSRLAVFG